MNTIRKTMAALLCIFAAIPSFADNGSSCEQAIKIVKDENQSFNYKVEGAKTVWFTASTYDLPIKVCFTPANPNDEKPEVWLDFTCNTNGYYDDPNLCNLFCKDSENAIQVDLPYKAVLEKEGDSYCLSVGKNYRDLLVSAGVDYPVDVFVKVIFKSAGGLSLIPDTEFSDCMDGGKIMRLGDTVNIKDSERYFILPLAQWQEDSIRVIWHGESRCRFVWASTCQFDPTDGSNGKIVDRPFIQPDEPFRYTAEEISYYVSMGEKLYNTQAGMYYARVVSDSPGYIKIERIPMAPPDGNATLLRYGKASVVNANDTLSLYAIHRDSVHLRFTSPTNHSMKMYVGTSASFLPSNAIATLPFNVAADDKGGHVLQLDSTTVVGLWSKTSPQSNYLYVRFLTSGRTSVTMHKWAPSDCAKKFTKLSAGEIEVPNKSSKYYRLNYNEWKDGNLEIKWVGTTSVDCVVWVDDSCSYSSDDDNPHHVDKMTIVHKKTKRFTSEQMKAWKDRVLDDGSLYILFYCKNSTGNVYISDPPEEIDPTYPMATVSVTCEGSKVLVNVQEDQAVVIEDSNGTEVDSWDAQVGEPHELNLEPGIYTLRGKIEKIQIKL